MKNSIFINKKITSYNKKITVSSDKSISIRWALIASQAIGKSKASNLLISEDVLSTLNCLKKLGIKMSLNKKKQTCEILGNGINGFNYKKNITLNANNSGTLARLICGLLVRAKNKIRIIGDKSLSRRDFSRVTQPLNKFGVNFYPKFKNNLPLSIQGTDFLRPIQFEEKKGSAQVKSLLIFAAMNAPGTTIIRAKKSRDHTEKFLKYLKTPIKTIKKRNHDIIEISETKNINPINYKIPGDISSAAFFIVLTVLSENSKLLIKNVLTNPTRTGIIKILKKMGAKIILKNKRLYKGEEISDIFIKSTKSLKSINCPENYNASAIDEFLIIFLVAAKAKGYSYFKNLSELNKKESPRLEMATKILKMMGVKIFRNKDSIKILGNPKLNLNKTYKIKNFYNDHRVFMMSVIAGLCFGGKWKIHNKNSIKTSFPEFLNLTKLLGAKYN